MRAAEIKKGTEFTYVGAFVHYWATSDAKPDPTYPGKVVIRAARYAGHRGTLDIGIRLDADASVEVQP